MNNLLLLPVIIPLACAALMVLAWKSLRIQRVLGVAGAAGMLIAGLFLLQRVRSEGILVLPVGNWPAPFGISMVADLFSGMLVVLAGVIGLVVTLYSLSSIDQPRVSFGYYPLVQILLMGVCGAFLTGDLFNLYVWFEVMLIASFVLLTLGGSKEQILGGLKYVTLNLLSSAIFLAAAGLLYSITGTLNMADLAGKLGLLAQPGLATVLAMLFLVAFGIKAAIFPLFYWLPASYHTPPVPVSALFSGLLTKVGVYALVRVFTLLFTQNLAFTHTLILAAGGLTMVTGVLGAVAQYEFRRLLSFHIISQIGYLLMGLGLFTAASLSGMILFMAHIMLSKAALFLVSGLAYDRLDTFELKEMGGLYRSAPGLALLFLIPALSLAGMPPLSGFFAKLSLVQAGLAAGQYAIVATALGVSILTLYSMIKIWNEAFWKPLPQEEPETGERAGERQRLPVARILPVAGLVALVVLIGLGAQPVFELAGEAAGQLLDPEGYIRAVLGD